MAEKTLTREQYLKELPEIVKNMDGFRQGSNKSLPVDIHLGDMLQEKYGLTQEDYFKAIGFNPKVDTMENIYLFQKMGQIFWLELHRLPFQQPEKFG
mgnify:CR=1 FL=1